MIKDFFSRPFTIDRIARIFFALLLLFLLGWGIRSMSAILIPFFLAWLVAYMLMPVVRFFQQKLRLRNRIVSVTIVLILFFAILFGAIMLLIPSITEEVNKAWELSKYYASSDTLLNLLPEALRQKMEQYTDVDALMKDFSMEKLVESLQNLVSKSWGLFTSTVAFLMSFTVVFLFILYLIFILIDYEDLGKGAIKLVPQKYKHFVIEAIQNVRFYVNNYFRGQSLIALCVGVMLAIGWRIMGLPLGISLGLIVGIFNLVPYLQWAGIPPLILLCLLQSADTGQNLFVVLGIALGILMVVQIIQDMILTPHIMGKTMGMKPAVILLSLSVWGSFFGLLGMLFALPLTMICYSYYMKYVVGKPIKNSALLVEKKPSSLSKLIQQTEAEKVSRLNKE